MRDPKATVVELFGRLLLKQAYINDVQRPASSYTILTLDCPSLRGAQWTPGDKIQLLLSHEGMRTFTPFAFDGEHGGFKLLAFVHGEGLASRWAMQVKVGDTVRFLGLSDSLSVAATHKPCVVFGDETSMGLAAAAKESGALSHAVLEVADPDASQSVAKAYALSRITLVHRQKDEGHLPQLASSIQEALADSAGSHLVLSGRTAAIQGLRRLLKQSGVQKKQQVKAYWALGKAGLD